MVAACGATSDGRCRLVGAKAVKKGMNGNDAIPALPIELLQLVRMVSVCCRPAKKKKKGTHEVNAHDDVVGLVCRRTVNSECSTITPSCTILAAISVVSTLSPTHCRLLFRLMSLCFTAPLKVHSFAAVCARDRHG